MGKERRKYFQIPLVKTAETCPICNASLVTSKLRLILYSPLNDQVEEGMHKVKYCNNCHLPFVTNSDVKGIETEHSGFHVETRPVTANMTREFLTKRTEEQALPIKNMPKGRILFLGEIKDHNCDPKYLKTYQYWVHGAKDSLIRGYSCSCCKRIIIQPSNQKRFMTEYPDYMYVEDRIAWNEIFQDKKTVYLLNVNQYTKDTCPSCGKKLTSKILYFKNDKDNRLQQKKIKECISCKNVFARTSSFAAKPYQLYKFSYNYYQEEPFRTEGKHIVIRTGDFLTRHNMQYCISQNHSMEDITARIRLVDKNGQEFDYDVPAVRCDTCGKLFLLEAEYQKIRAKGIPLCSIVENTYWRERSDAKYQWSATDHKGSVMYTHGYNVNAYEDLSMEQRHCILKTLLRDNVLTKAEICSHLDTLIQRASGQAILKNAKKKWEMDRDFVENYDKETETVRVNSIFRKEYKRKENL